jgi:hypothetical protein
MEVRILIFDVRIRGRCSSHDVGLPRAIYVDGQMTPSQKGASGDPKPCAGNDGTTITVRRQSCRSVFYPSHGLYMRAVR